MPHTSAPRFDVGEFTHRTTGPVSRASAPVYDPLVLMALAHEAGEEVAQRFLDDFLDLLSGRRSRIVRALMAGQTKVALDAVISLKVTSAIVGATWLSHYCGQLQQQLPLGDPAHAAEINEELDLLATSFVRAVNAKQAGIPKKPRQR